MGVTITVERNVPVAMRDGVKLATDVYRPAGSGRFPVLVHRTPYNKADAWVVGGLMFNPLDAVERGYVVVVQDSRGRFASEGRWIPFAVERADGFDTVEWAAAQAWSDGRVGIYGSSYNGVTALQAAVAAPPHLRACVAYMTGTDYHEGWVYSGGAFELGFNLWWSLHQAWDSLTRGGRDPVAAQAAADHLGQAMIDPWPLLQARPLRDMPLFRDNLAPYYYDWLDHPARDEYWQDVDAAAATARIRVPVLHLSGWYDGFLRGHLDLDKQLRSHPDDHVRENSRFILGPWEHMAYLGLRKSAAGEREFGPIGVSGPALLAPLCFAWFDRWVAERDVPTPRAPVRYFLMERNEWREAPTWPPPGRALRYFAGGNGHANGARGNGRLRLAPESGSADHYVYDPADPVPTVGGRSMTPGYCTAGVQDRSQVEQRPDVLVYTSAVLTDALCVAGPVTVALHAASSAVDTDFTATLVDVAPDGACTGIAEGIIRARYRHGTQREELLVPDQPAKFHIDLLAVAHEFQTGHCIRLEISSSNFPKYDPNPNAAVQPALATAADLQRAQQTIFHDPERPSSLTLWVVEEAPA